MGGVKARTGIATVERRPITETGLKISAVGLGCVTFGREIDEETAYRMMDYAVEKGITFFDTSQNYGGGQSRRARREMYGVDDRREVTGEMSSSEAVIGRWLRKRGGRDRITLCSKVWSIEGPESISEALDATLERLGTGHVEIYKLHKTVPDVPMAELLGALAAEVESRFQFVEPLVRIRCDLARVDGEYNGLRHYKRRGRTLATSRQGSTERTGSVDARCLTAGVR